MSNLDRAAAHGSSHDGHGHEHGTPSTSSRKLAAVAIVHLVGFVAVLVSVVAIEVTEIRVVDPVTATLVAVVITWSAVTVLRGSGEIVQQSLLEHVVQGADGSVEAVTEVDDLHAWQIYSQLAVATAHLETGAETLAEAEAVTHRVHDELAQFGVDHAIVELCPDDAGRAIHRITHRHS